MIRETLDARRSCPVVLTPPPRPQALEGRFNHGRPSDASGDTAVVTVALFTKLSEAPLTEEIAQFTLIFQPRAKFAVFPP